MKRADFKSWATLPACCEVRRTALAAGAVTALLTGGLPFVGFDSGLVMGRASMLPSVLAFPLHLALSMVYGVVLCLGLSRSRESATLWVASLMTSAIYAVNYAVMLAWGLPRLLPETDSIIAHAVFGTVFTVFFRLAEIGTAETPSTSSSKPTA